MSWQECKSGREKKKGFEEILIVPIWTIHIRQSQIIATDFPWNDNKAPIGVWYDFGHRKWDWFMDNNINTTSLTWEGGVVELAYAPSTELKVIW